MCVLSTQNESSCSSTARQSTHTSKSTFGMVEPGSGRIMSQDITEKPHFAARGGNRRIFGSVHAFSQPIVANQFYRLHTIIIWECRERMNMRNVGQGGMDQEIHASKGTVGGDFGGSSWRCGGGALCGRCLHSSTGRISFFVRIRGQFPVPGQTPYLTLQLWSRFGALPFRVLPISFRYVTMAVPRRRQRR